MKRKEKKVAKQKWLRTNKQETGKASEMSAKRLRDEGEGDPSDEDDDWDELAREERMAKKMKRGEITQKDFDAEFTDL